MSKPGNFAQQQQPTFDETPAQPENVELKLASTGNFDLSQAYGNDRRTQSGKFTLAQLRATEGAKLKIFFNQKNKKIKGICPLQNGTNQFDSQKLMTGFGTPRDVKGKHLKRIWELEFPEEAADYQPPPVNAAPQQFQQQPFSPTQQQQPQQFQQRAGQPQQQFAQQPQQRPGQPQQQQQQQQQQRQAAPQPPQKSPNAAAPNFR
ncbi:unnamed protein product [Meloidogyne enterolobii]|uniref:Uncharacterized protein n=1 Tax=Meloidogyne enterolobii TaxID=390850 RepID=A0ACB1A294_MELEN